MFPENRAEFLLKLWKAFPQMKQTENKTNEIDLDRSKFTETN